MNEECLICKAPLEYLNEDVEMECELCHKKEKSKTRYANGHYVSMGCNVACPSVPGKQVLNWGLEDPTGSGDEAFLKVIREIETNIKKLREQL